ncbi:MAG: FTR1 family iron permease [Denitromonas halophila]|nr:MAG: FTR1 family iron permease [Denitromonas halophila]TVT75273.1 MAG: FTR1 family iron permease [Denitromonas halophila]TVT76677.1 MAG: FTR1 family iron permease [Denitromonas halophila]
MGNATFIVWRESVEAILIIAILYSWIQARGDGRIRLRHLWLGVAGGIGLALALAAAMLGFHSQLAGTTLEAFQAGIMIVAALLVTHMVVWMRHHGRTLKRDLESGLARAAEETGGLSAALLAAIAVGREGAETVLFLYGIVAENPAGGWLDLMLGAALGAGLAAATAVLFMKGSRLLPQRVFFRISEVLLLLLASGLLVSGLEGFLNLEWLPPLLEPVWDSGALLEDNGLLGTFAGYRARPALSVLALWLLYWVATLWLLRPKPAAKGGRWSAA